MVSKSGRIRAARHLVVVLLSTLPACAAVIGIKDLIPDPGGSDGGDGGDGDSMTNDVGDVGDTGATSDVIAIDGGDGGCGDTISSGDHCGRCNHSCLGGKCESSVCQPVALATGQGQVGGVALDGLFVYFTSLSSNVVERVSKSGGSVEVLAKSPNVSLSRRIAVNGTHVYWANINTGTIERCVIGGCNNTGSNVETIATGSQPFGLALNATHVYWADHNANKIERALLDGGARELIGQSEGALPFSIALPPPGDPSQAYAYWIGDFFGEVRRNFEPADGGSIAIGENGQSGRDLALDSTYVYWGAAINPGDPGRINRAPRDGTGPSQILGVANGEPISVVIDGAQVVWTAQAAADAGVPQGGVYACDITGCNPSPRALAKTQDQPRGLAVDSAAIYWGVNGFVYKLAK